MKKIFIRNNFLLLFIALFYFIAGLLLLHFTAYYTDSPDTIFYLTISKKYASANFSGAINNYWSPLISWLLIPVFLTGTDPLTGFKILQLMLGVAGLYFAFKLTNHFLENALLKNALQVAFVPAFLSYALMYQTPDLLFLVLLLALFSHLLLNIRLIPDGLYEIQKQFTFRQIAFGFISGLLGALLYFAKAYGLPFFLASFIFFLGLYYFRAVDLKDKFYFRNNFLTGIAVFFILASGWMGCLFYKYHTFSTGYASVYNFNLLAPGKFIPGTTNLQHPVLTNGLMDISSREEASAWESPGNSHERVWSPLENKTYFIHYLKILKHNLLSFYYFIVSRNIGLIFLVSFIFYLILIKAPINKIAFEVKLLFMFLLIYVAGYALIFFMPRYLWICYIVLPLFTFHLAETAIKENNKRKFIFYPLAFFMLILLVKKPVKEILFKADTAMSSKHIMHGIIHPSAQLASTYHQSMALPALMKDIKTLQLQKGKVAGISSQDLGHYSYTQSLLLCMYLDQPFYGELPDDMGNEERLKQLHTFDIDYVYVWGSNVVSFQATNVLLKEPACEFTLIKLAK